MARVIFAVSPSCISNQHPLPPPQRLGWVTGDFSMSSSLTAVAVFAPTRSSRCLPNRRRIGSCSSFRCSSELACNSVSVADLSGVLHNKVLLSAAVSAAIGQFSKPFASSLLYGKEFNWRASIGSGGFPSTHSSAAVATATSLLLERGFSDSIFGLAVVYASLVMYDSQGVRREVGRHAKVLNRPFLKTKPSPSSSNSNELMYSSPVSSSASASSEKMEPPNSNQTKPMNSPLLFKLEEEKQRSSVASDSSNSESSSELSDYLQLKESVGHTEVEVAAGALLGFLVSIAVAPYA